MNNLIKAKQKIKRLFPQLKKYDFRIWQGAGEDIFNLQCCINDEFYGNIYQVNFKNKTLYNCI
jgi:hypothetical protein